MAFGLRSVTTVSPGSATSFAPAKPSGTADTDLLVAALLLEDNLLDAVITGPGGSFSTPSVDFGQTAGSPDLRLLVYFARAGASEPASYTWSWTGSLWRYGCIAAFTDDAPDAAPLDAIGAGSVGAATTSATAASIAPAESTDVLIYAMGNDNNPTTVPTPMANVGTVNQFRMAYEILSAAGATGARTSTINSGRFVAVLAAFKAATGGGGATGARKLAGGGVMGGGLAGPGGLAG